MHKQIEGVYRNGKVELSQQPDVPENTRVTVTFDVEKSVTEAERLEAIRQLIEQMRNSGVRLGGKPYESRDELYADRLNRWIR